MAPNAGGDLTAYDTTNNAFGLSSPTLSREQRRTFEIGDSLFTQNWVTAPATTDRRDGLGPLLNAEGCASCHTFDGRARPPISPSDSERGLLLRLSVRRPDGREVPHPVYGDQLQDRSILGVRAEGAIQITTAPVRGQYGDGTPFELVAPRYRIVNPAYGRLGENLLVSPRIAQQVVGMGLLDAIPEANLVAAADPDDADRDGISGRPNRVADAATGKAVIGRLGWKANAANTDDQTAGAFRGDVGITSPRAPAEPCGPTQAACRRATSGGRPEIDAETIGKVAFYVRTLAVPARRNLDSPQVRAGAEVFASAGCTGCHTPIQRTGEYPVATVANQTIHPFSDLLLHDMGPGLADGRRDHLATGNEWRTAPLWGIGLVEPINGHTRFLHDGRARNLAEAVLWHGGEAQASREAFRKADASQRAALLAFLRSL